MAWVRSYSTALLALPGLRRRRRAGLRSVYDASSFLRLEVADSSNRLADFLRAVVEERLWPHFDVVRTLTGHGIGRTIHEDPMVPNWYDPRARERLTEGLVITVEPIIAMGSGESYDAGDGWTIRTLDGSLAAHFEHTLVVTKGAPLLLTAA